MTIQATTSPVDGRVYVERELATASRIESALALAVRAQKSWRERPGRRARRDPAPVLRCLRGAPGCDRDRAGMADGPADPLRAERGARNARAGTTHDRDRTGGDRRHRCRRQGGLHALPAPRAAGSRADGGGLELPVPDRRQQRGAGDPRGQRRAAQALRADSALRGAVRGMLPRGRAARRASSRFCTWGTRTRTA